MDQAALKNLLNIELELIKITNENLKGMGAVLAEGNDSGLIQELGVTESALAGDSASQQHTSVPESNEPGARPSTKSDYGTSRVIRTKDDVKALEKLVYAGRSAASEKNNEIISYSDDVSPKPHVDVHRDAAVLAPAIPVCIEFTPDMLFSCHDDEDSQESERGFTDDDDDSDEDEEQADDADVQEINPTFHCDLMTKI